jgi:TPR repeat protein
MNMRSASLVFTLGLAALVGSSLLIDGDERANERGADVAAGAPRPIARDKPAPASSPAASSPAPSQEEPSGAPEQVRDWARRFHESTDDFSLAKEMAAASLEGDGQAQYRLGRLLLRCEVYKRILVPYGEGSVADLVETHLAGSTFTEQGRAEFRRGALRCGRLFTEDPFADFDLPQSAGDFRYWGDQAVASGDPLAVINRAFRSATDRTSSDDPGEEQAFRNSLLGDARRVVFSGDAAALYVLGGLFSHPSIAADLEDGYAWIVAACESGYDCSNANPDVGGGCVERGTCEPGHTFLDVLQKDLGAGKYGAIYASAQDIKYKIKTNDWDGMQQYLQLKE